MKSSPFPRLLKQSVLVLLLSGFSPAAWGFPDAQSHWGRACISQLSQQRLVSGYPDNRFRPNNPVTRAEFAVLMLNAFPNAPRSRPAQTFRDVPATHWASRAIRDATERAFFAGYPDQTFRPSQPIPRVQAIAIVANALNQPIPARPDATLNLYFDDASQTPAYARGAIAAGALRGLAVNAPDPRQLQPNRSATRGEIAGLLCQALGLEQTIPDDYVAGGTHLLIDGPAYAHEDPALRSRFFTVLPFVDGIAAAAIVPDAWGTRWGFINRQGNWVIEPRFSQTDSFSEGLAAVRLEDKVGFVDRTGRMAIAPQFVEALPFSEGLAAVRLGDEWGFIDPSGNLVIPPQFAEAQSFQDGLARIQVNESYPYRYGFINPSGDMVIAPQYSEANDFSEGVAAVKTDQDRWGYIGPSGDWVIAPQFLAAQSFSEGLAGVLIDDRWGFIDKTGAIAIAPRFYPPQAELPDEPVSPYADAGVAPFSSGLARVRLGERSGFIDRTGTFVIEPQFADAESFRAGFARVNVGGQWVAEPQGFTSNAPPTGPYVTSLSGGDWGYIRRPQ